MTAAVAPSNIERLYSEHEFWLRSWLKRHTRCPQRAADLAQDTFCRLLQQSAHESPDRPRAYLATIARRLLINDSRRRSVEQTVTDIYLATNPEVETITPERILEAVQLLDMLLQALETLPVQARDAFMLRKLEGLDHLEIAARLGISRSTVKRHIAMGYARCYPIVHTD